MKTYILSLIISLVSFAGYAQNGMPPNDTFMNNNQNQNQNYNYNSPNNNPNSQGYKNSNLQGWKDSTRMSIGSNNPSPGKTMKAQSYYLRNGKLYQYSGGKLNTVNNTVTFKNGTTLSTNGMVKMKNGKSVQLQTTEGIDMNGDIAPYKP